MKIFSIGHLWDRLKRPQFSLRLLLLLVTLFAAIFGWRQAVQEVERIEKAEREIGILEGELDRLEYEVIKIWRPGEEKQRESAIKKRDAARIRFEEAKRTKLEEAKKSRAKELKN
jgi:hypothetical protein